MLVDDLVCFVPDVVGDECFGFVWFRCGVVRCGLWFSTDAVAAECFVLVGEEVFVNDGL